MSNSRLIDRRKFIRSTALAAGGLIISFNDRPTGELMWYFGWYLQGKQKTNRL